MEHRIFIINHVNELAQLWNDASIASSEGQYTLVQIFGCHEKAPFIEEVCHSIKVKWPQSTVLGVGTSAQIAFGRTLSHSVTVSVMRFASATFKGFINTRQEQSEHEMVQDLKEWLTQLEDMPKCLLLSASSMTLDAYKLSDELNHLLPAGIPILGGGVGSHLNAENSFIWLNGHKRNRGFAVILLHGAHLELFSKCYLGWKAFSQEMKVTKAQGRFIHTINHRPAVEVYEHYLGIKRDQNFRKHINGFPFLYEYGSDYQASVPIDFNETGSLYFLSDQQEGRVFRLGYADPAIMVSTARQVQDQLYSFAPEAILIYSCISRAELLGDDVDLETYPYELIAPTAGFYTAGEFHAVSGQLSAMNSVLVVLGIKESRAPLLCEDDAYLQWREGHTEDHIKEKVTVKDPHAVARLVHFINVVTEELKETNQTLAQTNLALANSNRALEMLSTTDKLTQTYNRLKLDELIHQELTRANRYGSQFSVILLDVDHFKQVNDAYGHLVGDDVLVAIVNVLKKNLVRETDYLGRWGGEEFLIILPENELDQALHLAQKLCRAIDQSYFVNELHPTCSFGVTSYQTGDTEDSLLSRVDEALFRAKALGRNRVEYL